MSARPHGSGHDRATQIACLACGETRVVFGQSLVETGECPRCHYLGWTFADELDGWTRRQIMNGRLASYPPPRVA